MLFSWECSSEPTNLSETNGSFFSSKLTEFVKTNDAIKIVINCNNVVDIDDHFLDPIQEFMVKNKVELYFYSNDEIHNLVNYLDDHFDQNLGINVSYFKDRDTSVISLSKKSPCSSDILKLIEKTKVLEENGIRRIVTDAYFESSETEVLSSTPLIATGQFNATEIISDPSSFRWLVLLFVEAIHKVVQIDKPKKYTIVASSLRGAAIAGSVKELLHFLSGPDLYVIDHIGPNHDVIEKPLFNNFGHSDYCVYIGDFLIAGTELKITQAYCGFMGGKIKHAFVIGKYINQEYLGNNINLHSLVKLTDCVKGLDYKVG
jgi:hypothetical protein